MPEAVTLLFALVILYWFFIVEAVLVLFAFRLSRTNPSLGRRWFIAAERWVGRLAVRRGLSVAAVGVLALAVISMAFGAYGVLSVDNLTQITLASNTGTFLVYGMTNLIVLVAFWGKAEHNVLKHIIVPMIGFLANLAMLGAIVYLNLTSGGSTATDTVARLSSFWPIPRLAGPKSGVSGLS